MAITNESPLHNYKHARNYNLKHVVAFCALTNKCTIISQIIALLKVSTLSCHPQGTCNQYLAKLHKHFKSRY